jgi:hypothetical protein
MQDVSKSGQTLVRKNTQWDVAQADWGKLHKSVSE